MDNLIIREATTEAYNASVQNINAANKSLVDTANLAFDGGLPTLVVEMCTQVWQKTQELITEIQALYFMMLNYDKSFKESAFTYPEIKSINRLHTRKINSLLESKNLLAINENQKLQALNIEIKSIYKNSKSLYNVVQDTTINSIEIFYNNFSFLTQMQYVLTNLYVAAYYIATQYNIVRGTDNFYKLMKLKAKTNPILDSVPVFPTLPVKNPDDFGSFCAKYNIPFYDFSSQLFDRIDFSGYLPAQKYILEKYESDSVVFSVSGYYIKIGQATNGYDQIFGYFTGTANNALSEIVGCFIGLIAQNSYPTPENYGVSSRRPYYCMLQVLNSCVRYCIAETVSEGGDHSEPVDTPYGPYVG